MKILLAFLITFSIQSAPKHAEINAMTIDSTIYQLLHRMEFPVGSCSFLEDEEELLSTYDEMFGCTPTKPSMLELSNELISYQAELHAERTAEIAEMARIKDIKDRLKALKHKKQSIRSIVNVANPMAWLRDNIHSMDHALMESKIIAIEAKDVEHEASFQTQKSEETTHNNLKAFFRTAKCNLETNELIKKMCKFIKRKSR